MKNANEKYVEYARVIEMCKGTKFENEPWKCIRGGDFRGHIRFGNEVDLEFAVAIVEDEPVFVGDPIFIMNNPHPVNWGLFDYWKKDIDRLSKDWTRTMTKRTFMLNGVELPRPSKTGKVSFGFVSDLICFESYSDAEKVSSAIKRILEDATK